MLWLKKDFNYICEVFDIHVNLIDMEKTIIVQSKVTKDRIKFDELENLVLELKNKDFSIGINTINDIENCYIKFNDLKQNTGKVFIEDLISISYYEFDIEIRFDKSSYLDKDIYIYGRLETFINELKQNWINNDIFKFSFKDTKKSTILIIEEENLFAENKFLIICNCDTYTSKNIKKQTLDEEFRLINISNANCNWINVQHKYSPNVFNLETSNNEKIDSIFRDINTILILMHISNYVELKQNKILCIINSVKRVSIKVPNLCDLKVKKEEYDWIFKCFKLVYESDNIDKFSILRNVIGSLIVCRNQGDKYRTVLENSKWIYESTNDNWEMFLSSNIDKYFEKKYKLIEEIKNKTQQLHEKASNIVKDIYKNAISIILLVVGSIVGKNAKVIKWSSIIGIIYLTIYGMAYLPLMFIEKNDINDEFQELTKKYEKEFNPNEEELCHDRKKFKSKNSMLNVYIYGYIFVYLSVVIVLGCFFFFNEKVVNIISE